MAHIYFTMQNLLNPHITLIGMHCDEPYNVVRTYFKFIPLPSKMPELGYSDPNLLNRTQPELGFHLKFIIHAGKDWIFLQVMQSGSGSSIQLKCIPMTQP